MKLHRIYIPVVSSISKFAAKKFLIKSFPLLLNNLIIKVIPLTNINRPVLLITISLKEKNIIHKKIAFFSFNE